jgi:hypothetical protein
MAQVQLALEGCICVSLGVQTPLLDIARAAAAMRPNIVALGFSGCLGLKQMHDALAELRAELQAETQLWAGGTAPGLQRRPIAGVQVLDTLAQIPQALRRSGSAPAT